jgi:hypothetical protein
MPSQDVDLLERELIELSAALTGPRVRECLLCYVYRVLEFGCDTSLRWARRWRDLRAPRATGLERRLYGRGAFCDCEIFMNGWQPRVMVATEDGAQFPDQMPTCPGVRAGSTQPCALWVPQQRPRVVGW